MQFLNRTSEDIAGLEVALAEPELTLIDSGELATLQLLDAVAVGEPAMRRFSAELGDVPAATAAEAYWQLSTPVSGSVKRLSMALTVRSPEGYREVVTPTEVETHNLVRPVWINDENDDGRLDFLVNDTQPDANDFPDAVYTSDGRELSLSVDVGATLTEQEAKFGYDRAYTLSATMQSGWTYLSGENPTPEEYGIFSVQRGDGTSVPMENVWLTRRMVRNTADEPEEKALLHLLDTDNGGTYTIVFRSKEGLPPNTPPVADAGTDQEVLSGGGGDVGW